MYEHVTIVPEDNVIIVDRIALEQSGFGTVKPDILSTNETIHAIQWHNNVGHIEFSKHGIPNQIITGQKDYETYVLPFVKVWEQEKQRAEEEANRPVPLEFLKDNKLSETKKAYLRALAGVVALSDPNPTQVAIEAAILAQEDAEGLIFVKEKLETQYKALVKKIEACVTVEEVAKVTIAFDV